MLWRNALSWFDPRNKSEGRQARHWVGGTLATHAALVLSLSKDGRALPWFDKLTTG